MRHCLLPFQILLYGEFAELRQDDVDQRERLLERADDKEHESGQDQSAELLESTAVAPSVVGSTDGSGEDSGPTEHVGADAEDHIGLDLDDYRQQMGKHRAPEVRST